MILAPTPTNELERLRALYALKILDSKPEALYDRVTRIARELFGAPIAAISFVANDRIWFKSITGLEVDQISRCTSFCGHTICLETTDDMNSRILEIPDTKLDPRFSDNPLVIEKPKIQYYMGFILQSADRLNLGTICILDTHPRKASQQWRESLIDLGLMIQDRIYEQTIENVVNEIGFEDITMASNIAKSIFHEFDLMLKDRGITINEWRILDQIEQGDQTTPSVITNRTGISPPMLSQLLEKLEEKELITRNRWQDEDKRKITIESTKQGKALWLFGKDASNEIVKDLRSKYLTNSND